MPQLLQLLALVALALRDGTIDSTEAADILEEGIELAHDAAEDHLPDLIEWVRDLVHRDREELLAAAARHEAKGHERRAERLRRKAERRS